MEQENNKNGWSKSELYVMNSLETINENINTLYKKLDHQADHNQRIELQLNTLKTKIAVWGAMLFAASSLLSPLAGDVVARILR